MATDDGVDADDETAEIRTGIVAHGDRVEIKSGAGELVVEAAGGELRVTAPSGVWELGATRAGIRVVLQIYRDEVCAHGNSGVGAVGSDDTQAIVTAVIAALRAASASAHPEHVDDSVETMRPTPLLYAAPLLASAYVMKDLAAFRACRIVLAHLEDDRDDDATPEHAEQLVEWLEAWRDRFAWDERARRPANSTVAAFGETASVYALCGLQRVPMTRKASSLSHCEVLGCLGAHPQFKRLRTHMALVERAPQATLDAALDEAKPALLGLPDNIDRAHAFAELLAAVPTARDFKSLEVLVAAAHTWRVDAMPSSTPTALPPIPLPSIKGVRFLKTFGDIVIEGKLMRHCVATRRSAAATGQAFIFHVGTDVAGATVQIDRHGRLVEARGYENKASEAVAWATRVMTAWGHGFWAPTIGLYRRVHTLLTSPSGPQLQGDDAVLVTVEDCFQHYRRACAVDDDYDGALAEWFARNVERAVRGEVAIIHRTLSAGPAVVVLDRWGQELTRALLTVPRRQRLPG